MTPPGNGGCVRDLTKWFKVFERELDKAGFVVVPKELLTMIEGEIFALKSDASGVVRRANSALSELAASLEQQEEGDGN